MAIQGEPDGKALLLEIVLGASGEETAMSAEVIVRELICDLLCEAVEGDVSSEEAVPGGVGDHYDIATHLHLHLQGRIISSFSLRCNRVEVVQLRCVEQRASGSAPCSVQN